MQRRPAYGLLAVSQLLVLGTIGIAVNRPIVTGIGVTMAAIFGLMAVLPRR